MLKRKIPDCSFIDVHSHIIPAVDDGAQDSSSAYTREQNKTLFEILKKCTKLKLYLGNELYIDECLDGLLSKGIVSSLAGSKYVLVELPMSGHFADYEDILLDLSRNIGTSRTL